MSVTYKRNKVAKLAKDEPSEALKIAKTITDPWYQAQAFSHILRYTDNPSKIKKHLEKVVQRCDDPYKRSAVGAWEIAAYAERGELGQARKALTDSLERASSVTPASSQSEALILLLHAAARIGLSEAYGVAEKLRDILDTDTFWRCSRAVIAAVAILTNLDVASAKKLTEGINDEKTKTKCLATIEDGGMAPKVFFW